jgi:hypothetical protein
MQAFSGTNRQGVIMTREMSYRRAPVFWRAASVALLISAACETPVATAVDYNSATITFISSPTPSANCVYFMLAGVTQADPVSQGNSWFAVPATQNGFSQIYAMLLSVKLVGGTVNVTTTGTLAGGTCGNYAGIDHVTAD